MVRIITSAWLGYNQARVGGYSFTDEEGTKGNADFVDWIDVLKVAEQGDIKWVHLAGDWSDVGYRGFGQKVHISQAKKIVKKYG